MRELKQYTIDTNVIRYDTDKTANRLLNKAAKSFWTDARNEIENGNAVILVPAEVVRELVVQSHNLPPKENNKINLILKSCIEISPPVSMLIEHQIRNMSAYLRKHYREDLKDFPMSYGGVSDARILYSAYYEDSILVTANIKDFLLYPFLFAQHEERLYNLKFNKYIQIPESVYAKVWQDNTFKGMFNELKDLELAVENHEDL